MSKKDQSSKKVSKKEARQLVYDKLAAALAEFKSNSGKDKKFESNLKKASKLFADDVVKAANKAKSKTPKTEKKAVKVKIEPKQEQQAAG
jgi:D-aminopeptidase